MVSTEFLITSFIVVLIPGTGVIYTVSSGLFGGWRAGLFASLGCTAGIIPHLIASIAGLAAILHMSAVAFQAMKFAGVAYLLYLAWATWCDKGSITFNSTGVDTSSQNIVVRGFLLNILNPKLSIFFLAFMPQFMATDAGSPLSQLLLLSSVFMAMTLAVFIVYGLLAHSIRTYVLASPGFLVWLKRSFGAMFAALGAKLALEER